MTLVDRALSDELQQLHGSGDVGQALDGCPEMAVALEDRVEDLKMALLLVVRANPMWSMDLSTEEEIEVDRIIADAESN